MEIRWPRKSQGLKCIFTTTPQKNSAKSISSNQLGMAPEEGVIWVCKISQPQTWTWYTSQHPEGFYMTTYAPDKFDDKKEKLGVSKLKDPYVLVFNFSLVKISDIKKVNNSKSSGNVKVKKVGEPEKYCF